MALSQLSRQVETRGGDKKPQLSDLRESGAIEQDADMVMFIYRPEYYKILEDPESHESTVGKAFILIEKHRSGSTGQVRLRWVKDYAKFENDDVSADGFAGGFGGDGTGGGFGNIPGNTGFDSGMGGFGGGFDGGMGGGFSQPAGGGFGHAGGAPGTVITMPSKMNDMPPAMRPDDFPGAGMPSSGSADTDVPF